MQKLRIPRFITQSQFPRHFGQRHGCGEFERYPPLRGGQYVGRDPGARRLVSDPAPPPPAGRLAASGVPFQGFDFLMCKMRITGPTASETVRMRRVKL